MIRLSVCVTTYQEQDNIGDCLKSVRGLADEIIVVDGGSLDQTRTVARRYTKNIFVRPNNPNLNINKNFGFSKARGEWVLCLDADEQVTPELAARIKEMLVEGTEWDGFLLPRKNYYFGRFLRYGSNYPDHQLRLFRRVKGQFAAKHVHERLQVQGRVGRLKEPLAHFPYKTISQYFQKFNFYTSFAGRFLYQKGVRIRSTTAFWFFYAKPLLRLVRRYIFKGGFLDGWQGLLACVFSYLTGIVSYAKCWELQQTERTPRG